MQRPIGVMLSVTVLGILATAGAACATGGLVFLQAEQNANGGVDGLREASGVAISPDGTNVYATSHAENAVSVFSRDPLSGKLTFVSVLRQTPGTAQGLGGAAAVTVSPDGAQVYVASDVDDAVAAFSRDPGTGLLTFIEQHTDNSNGVDGLDGAAALSLSPDGKHLYVAGRNDDAVAVFSRDPATGSLTFVELQKDGVGGVDGLNGASVVTTSADGTNVYVAGPLDDAVAVFARDTGTGSLTFVQAEHDGIGRVRSPDSLRGLVVSPDGKHVYATDATKNSVLTYSRDPSTGMLAWIDALRESAHGVSGIKGAMAIAISPDGLKVYVSGPGDSALVVFGRDPVTGSLSFVDKQLDQFAGVTGIASVRSIAASPDGNDVYTADGVEHALAVFAQDGCGSSIVTGDEQCDDGNTVDGDGCSSICRLELCGPTPAPDCLRPTVSQHETFRVKKKKANAGKDELVWRWVLDRATDISTFGSPLNSATYDLCIYDNSTAPQPLLSLAVPAGRICGGSPCWESQGQRGFRYANSDLTPNGVQAVLLRRELSGRARITVTGKGIKLGVRLPFSPTVTVQLKNTQTGVCWGASYAQPKVNDSEQFRATGF